MPYAQGAHIELGSAAATFRVNASAAVGAALRLSVVDLWPPTLRRMPRALGAPALETRNDDERTLQARICEAHARREGPGARPRVAKWPHRLAARARQLQDRRGAAAAERCGGKPRGPERRRRATARGVA